MAKNLFDIVKEGVKEEYAVRKYKASFNEFLRQLEAKPYYYTRTAFQMVADMIDSFGTREVLDCGEKIVRYKLFDDPFDKDTGAEFGKHAVFGLDRQIANMVNYIHTTANKGGDERIVLLHGPQGTAKTSIIRLLINGLQHYSRNPNGGIYTFDWVFVEDEFAEDVGFKLPHSRCKCSKSLAHLPDDDLFIRVPCQMNDHPLMLVPKDKRRAYLEHVVENGHKDVVIPKILLENELCKNCQTIYDKLLDKYEGDLAKVFNHIQVLRLLVSETEQIGAATVQPVQNIEANARLILREGASYQNLAALFPGIALHQFEGKWVDANRGILHFSDMFKRDAIHHNSLLSAVQEHLMDFNGVQATVDTLILATTNIEELVAVKGVPTNKALLDRTRVFDIPYLVRITDEMRVYQSKFKEAGYTESLDYKKDEHHIMPHIREFVALFAVLTRLYKPNHEYYDSSVDNETLSIIKYLTPVQKAFIYDDRIPQDLLPDEKKLITSPIVKRLLREEHNPLEGVKMNKKNGVVYVREGMGGISPRKVMDLITDILGHKEESESRERKYSCLGINDFKARLEKIVEAGIPGFVTYEKENKYLNIEWILKASIIHYDSKIQQDVQWAIIGMPQGELDKNILEYVRHAQAWVEKSTIYNPITKEHEPPNENKMNWLENILKCKTQDQREQHRRDVIIQIASAYQDARSNAEKEGIAEVPQLAVPELFEDYYELIYEHLLGDAVDRMNVEPEELQRSIQWLGTSKDQFINPPARTEIDRIIDNLKKRADYCNKCAKSALEYVFFDLMWDLNIYDRKIIKEV